MHILCAELTTGHRRLWCTCGHAWAYREHRLAIALRLGVAVAVAATTAVSVSVAVAASAAVSVTCGQGDRRVSRFLAAGCLRITMLVRQAQEVGAQFLQQPPGPLTHQPDRTMRRTRCLAGLAQPC